MRRCRGRPRRHRRAHAAHAAPPSDSGSAPSIGQRCTAAPSDGGGSTRRRPGAYPSGPDGFSANRSVSQRQDQRLPRRHRHLGTDVDGRLLRSRWVAEDQRRPTSTSPRPGVGSSASRGGGLAGVDSRANTRRGRRFPQRAHREQLVGPGHAGDRRFVGDVVQDQLRRRRRPRTRAAPERKHRLAPSVPGRSADDESGEGVGGRRSGSWKRSGSRCAADDE